MPSVIGRGDVTLGEGVFDLLWDLFENQIKASHVAVNNL